MDWLEYFVSLTEPSVSDPVMLILDDSFRHPRNLGRMFRAKKCPVALVCFTPLCAQGFSC